MKLGKLFATLALVSVLAGGCANNGAVMTINGEPITKTQYDEIYNKKIDNPQMKALGINSKSKDNNFLTLMMKQQAINELTIKTILEQEIKKKNIVVSEEEINKQLEDLIKQLGSKEQLDNIMKQNNITQAELKKNIKNEIEITKLLGDKGNVVISDKEAMDFYKKNNKNFQTPEMVRASHILILADKNNIKSQIVATDKEGKMTTAEVAKKVDEQMKAQKDKADALLAQIRKNPGQFAKFAKDNSQDTESAKKGGDLGFFKKADMVKPFADVAFTLAPNSISGVVATQYGYHIIMVTDKTKAAVTPFESVKNDIKAYMIQQQKAAMMQKMLDNLKNTAKIEYNDPSFNPENIQKEIKENAKNNPMMPQGAMMPQASK